MKAKSELEFVLRRKERTRNRNTRCVSIWAIRCSNLLKFVVKIEPEFNRHVPRNSKSAISWKIAYSPIAKTHTLNLIMIMNFNDDYRWRKTTWFPLNENNLKLFSWFELIYSKTIAGGKCKIDATCNGVDYMRQTMLKNVVSWTCNRTEGADKLNRIYDANGFSLHTHIDMLFYIVLLRNWIQLQWNLYALNTWHQCTSQFTNDTLPSIVTVKSKIKDANIFDISLDSMSVCFDWCIGLSTDVCGEPETNESLNACTMKCCEKWQTILNWNVN